MNPPIFGGFIAAVTLDITLFQLRDSAFMTESFSMLVVNCSNCREITFSLN